MKTLKMLAITSLIALPAMAAGAQDAKPDQSEKKICKREGAATGSILSTPRTCRTKAEWDAIAKANAANSDRFREDRERQQSMSRTS